MADHKKATAKEAIKEQRNKEGKYSSESLRANMSTGGGTPIEKGHKWTTEHRVLQPRDPDTGHFTFNADADLALKYKSHGKGNADPISYKQLGLNEDIKKGDVVNIGGKTWVAIGDIPADKVRDFFRHYDPETGEYYSSKEQMPTPDKATIEDAWDKISETVTGAVKLSDFLVKKRGRMSKAEKEGIEKGEKIVGGVDVEKLGKYTKEEISGKLSSMQKGFSPAEAEDQTQSPISEEKKAKNEEFNKKYDESLASVVKEAMGFGGGKGGNVPPTPSPEPAKPAEPAQEGAQEGQPSQPAKANPSEPNKAPKGLLDGNNHIVAAKVNYDDPEQKEYFDKMSADIQRDPTKYNCTPEQAKVLTGKNIAYLAKKGSLAKIAFDF